MAYRFKRKESVAKAVPRLCRERIEHALACLKDCDHAEAVHCARKDIKKVRAVLRLVRAQTAKKDFRRSKALLREAAADLAAARDAFIKVQTLRDLAEHFKKQLTPGALRHLRAGLRGDCDAHMRRFGSERTADAIGRKLSRVTKILRRLHMRETGWNALGPGVKATYRAGQRAHRTVLSDPSPENFHAWRKRVKDLWYHARLLERIWPEQMAAMAGELAALGGFLGDDHDLAVLRADVALRFGGDDRARGREREILNGLIEQRQQELRTAALAIGARFYAEKPAAFFDRLAGYWKTWRREKKPRAQVAAANG